jgi:transcriptional regulator with XRE-family HTH domain
MKNKHSSIASFGSFIRKLRTDLNITQRDLAKKLGIAPSYLNDLEKEKRGAPKQATIKKLSTILKTSLNQLNDLAGASKKELAPDITEYILSNPKMESNNPYTIH